MYAYVISPLSDKIRLVVASGGGPMLKYIVMEDDFRYVTTTMNKGEQLTYVLILANANKRGIQKLELAYERKCCVQLCGFTSYLSPDPPVRRIHFIRLGTLPKYDFFTIAYI